MTMPSSQECKAKAVTLIRESSDLRDLAEQAVAVAAAQVWATLATVPEPLEEVHGQLISAPNPFCEHGKYWTDCTNETCQ